MSRKTTIVKSTIKIPVMQTYLATDIATKQKVKKTKQLDTVSITKYDVTSPEGKHEVYYADENDKYDDMKARLMDIAEAMPYESTNPFDNYLKIPVPFGISSPPSHPYRMMSVSFSRHYSDGTVLPIKNAVLNIDPLSTDVHEGNVMSYDFFKQKLDSSDWYSYFKGIVLAGYPLLADNPNNEGRFNQADVVQRFIDAQNSYNDDSPLCQKLKQLKRHYNGGKGILHA